MIRLGSILDNLVEALHFPFLRLTKTIFKFIFSPLDHNEKELSIKNKIMSKLSKIKSDMERDYWMTPDEAKKYGLVDEIIEKS